MSNWDNRRPEVRGEGRSNRFASVYESVWRRYLMRSGIGTAVVIGCGLIGLTVAFHAHQQGNFHKLKLKANIDTDHAEAPTARPGGQDPIVLVRSQVTGDTTPQFLSITLLPGRGMNVLQITAYIPGRGEVNLLASPGIDGAAAALTGKGGDANGQASLSMGGAIEVPWAGDLGSAGSGQSMPDGGSLPPILTSAGAGGNTNGGLMLAATADSPDSEALPDGGSSHAVFHEGDFGGNWLSKTDVTVNAQMSSGVIELTITALNAGDVTEPVGIGWSPRFAIDNDDRGTLRLHIPADSRLEMRGNGQKQPTGKLLAVAGGPNDFSSAAAGIRADGLDEYYTDLQQKLLDNGPAAELINRNAGYGLRLTAMSGKMRVMRVSAPAGAGFVTIDPQYNFPDPFGKEWSSNTDTGMVTLEPGQSTEWKMRLEIYSLSDVKR